MMLSPVLDASAGFAAHVLQPAARSLSMHEISMRWTSDFPLFSHPQEWSLMGCTVFVRRSWKAWKKLTRCNCRRCRRFVGACCRVVRKSSLWGTHPEDYDVA